MTTADAANRENRGVPPEFAVGIGCASAQTDAKIRGKRERQLQPAVKGRAQEEREHRCGAPFVESSSLERQFHAKLHVAALTRV